MSNGELSRKMNLLASYGFRCALNDLFVNLKLKKVMSWEFAMRHSRTIIQKKTHEPHKSKKLKFYFVKEPSESQKATLTERILNSRLLPIGQVRISYQKVLDAL